MIVSDYLILKPYSISSHLKKLVKNKNQYVLVFYKKILNLINKLK